MVNHIRIIPQFKKILKKRESYAHHLVNPTWPHNNGPWGQNSCLLRDKEAIQPVVGLSPCFGPFPVLGSICTSLSCLSMCLSGPQAHLQVLAFLTPRSEVEWGLLFAAALMGMCRPTALHRLPGGPAAGHGKLTPTTEADLALSLILLCD